eukprot:351270-Chlamydomonas_euryale.AAC.9
MEVLDDPVSMCTRCVVLSVAEAPSMRHSTCHGLHKASTDDLVPDHAKPAASSCLCSPVGSGSAMSPSRSPSGARTFADPRVRNLRPGARRLHGAPPCTLATATLLQSFAGGPITRRGAPVGAWPQGAPRTCIVSLPRSTQRLSSESLPRRSTAATAREQLPSTCRVLTGAASKVEERG